MIGEIRIFFTHAPWLLGEMFVDVRVDGEETFRTAVWRKRDDGWELIVHDA